ncbi:MAG: nitroreductase family deazaflavin-dependent oxidoreductase, partial [Acidimicrobiia bacterium]|nr:nitroreductase family deazaflavin-dependent oxidoreductase [Acidimicrobiia bacterium]
MPLEPADLHSLTQIRTIDLTTFGRRSGEPARIEIWWFYFEDQFIVTGSPGRRDWMANAAANPRVIVHANGDSYHGQARPVSDRARRRRFFESDVTEVRWYSSQAHLDALVAGAPMIEI